MPRVAAVVLAAGEGRRVGAGTNKVLLPLAGTPVFAWSLRTVAELGYVDALVVVVRPQDRPAVEAAVAAARPGMEVMVVEGGDTRHGSEWNALQALADRIDAGGLDVVAIHDGARPLAGTGLWTAVVRAAHEHGGALPVREQHGLLGKTAEDQPGEVLAAVQTPQAFRAGPLLDAYRKAERDGFTGTDTASCVERYAHLPVHAVPSAATNLKITFPEDVALAERLLARDG